jgi:hypothetical protein
MLQSGKNPTIPHMQQEEYELQPMLQLILARIMVQTYDLVGNRKLSRLRISKTIQSSSFHFHLSCDHRRHGGETEIIKVKEP